MLVLKRHQIVGKGYLANMQKFKPVNQQQYFLLPPLVEDFIKEDHLARLMAEIVDNLDTTDIEKQYSFLGQKRAIIPNYC
jgi:transposase